MESKDSEALRVATVAATESDLRERASLANALPAFPIDAALKAIDTFECTEGAALWLIDPTNLVVGLNGKAPIEVVHTAEAVQAVLTVLSRIDHGISP